MINHDASERHQNNNLKAIIAYSNFLEHQLLEEINRKEEVSSFLQTKIKSKEHDRNKSV